MAMGREGVRVMQSRRSRPSCEAGNDEECSVYLDLNARPVLAFTASLLQETSIDPAISCDRSLLPPLLASTPLPFR